MLEKNQAKILIIDDDRDIVEVTKILLESRGYEIVKAHDGKTGLKMIRDEMPDIILLDVMLPDMNGFEICEILKKDSSLWHIPIIYFTARERLTERVLGFSSGGDDYVTKPFDPEELLARIKMILTRTYNVLDANPLTKLPGNHSIMKNIAQCLASQEKFSVCFLDIDNFKSFNDEYGFEKGDEIIAETAQIILRSVADYGNPSDFVGHIGGDDFVFSSTPEKTQKIAEKVIERFDAYAPTMYTEEVRKKGYVILKDRQGKLRKFPIMSISLSIVSNEHRQLTHMGEITSISSELKKYAKSFNGSVWVKDRRTDVIGPVLENKSTITPGFTGDRKELDDQSVYFEEMLASKKINIFFLPIYVYPGKETFGYLTVIKGISKKEVIQPKALFKLVKKTNRSEEFVKLCFEKIKVFTYGHEEIPKFFLRLSLPVFMAININDYIDIPYESLVLSFSQEDILAGDELFKARLSMLRQDGVSIALSDVTGQNIDLSFLSELKPEYIIPSDELIQGISEKEKNRQIIRILLNMIDIFSSKLLVTKVEDTEDLECLFEIGVELFQGPLLSNQ